MQFEGKVAVVTGAASGIGRAMTDAFAAKGMKVVMADIESEALEKAAQEVRGDGGDVFAVTADVSKAVDVERIAEAAIDVFGGLHVACNNAGVAAGGLTWEIDEDSWNWILGVNLWGVIHGVRSFTPRIIEQRWRPHREHGVDGRTDLAAGHVAVQRHQARRGHAVGDDVGRARDDPPRGRHLRPLPGVGADPDPRLHPQPVGLGRAGAGRGPSARRDEGHARRPHRRRDRARRTSRRWSSMRSRPAASTS